jgi:hypothetical protein
MHRDARFDLVHLASRSQAYGGTTDHVWDGHDLRSTPVAWHGQGFTGDGRDQSSHPQDGQVDIVLTNAQLSKRMLADLLDDVHRGSGQGPFLGQGVVVDLGSIRMGRC